MKMANYSESLGKPPSHEIILRCHPDDVGHPFVLHRVLMYQKTGKHVVIQPIRTS